LVTIAPPSRATKILAGIEAEASRDSNAASFRLLVGSSVSLASVLHEVDVVALRDFLQSVEVSHSVRTDAPAEELRYAA